MFTRYSELIEIKAMQLNFTNEFHHTYSITTAFYRS